MSAPRGGGSLGQLNRLLTLVPYLHARGSVRLSEAADLLGVTPQQLVKDLKVLFMCGLPGGYPDDLIDVDLDALETEDGALRSDGVITVSNADYLARPMRLTGREASAVIVALHALRDTADGATVDLVDTVLGKLTAAAGVGPVPIAGAAASPASDPQVERWREQLADALGRGVQVRLEYYTQGRDEVTTRVVDPHALSEHDGQAYLDAWCHRAGGARVFRLDRISGLETLSSPITTASAATDAPTDLFRTPSGADQRTRVTLRLGPGARWLTEYYPVENVREIAEVPGDVEADMLVADPRWLTRLLLKVAPHARVVTPAGFGDDVVSEARRALLGYRPAAK